MRNWSPQVCGQPTSLDFEVPVGPDPGPDSTCLKPVEAPRAQIDTGFLAAFLFNSWAGGLVGWGVGGLGGWGVGGLGGWGVGGVGGLGGGLVVAAGRSSDCWLSLWLWTCSRPRCQYWLKANRPRDSKRAGIAS